MKRLVDETTDELTRSLLTAGIDHQPPPGNKARLMVALGAGGAIGLFSSNAFAWLGTTAGKITAGKVTAVGLAVGVASAVWVAVPSAQQARSGDASASGAPPSATAQLPASVPADDRGGYGASELARISAGDLPNNLPNNLPNGPEGGAARLPDARGSSGEAPASDPSATSSPASLAPASVGAFDASERGSARRERSARNPSKKNRAREKIVASKQSELRSDELSSTTDAPPAGEALDWSAAERANLDSEVRLVDDMHWAVRRNDRAALGRFLERYRATFPDGQLKKEVAEFAQRLERPDLSGTR